MPICPHLLISFPDFHISRCPYCFILTYVHVNICSCQQPKGRHVLMGTCLMSRCPLVFASLCLHYFMFIVYMLYSGFLNSLWSHVITSIFSWICVFSCFHILMFTFLYVHISFCLYLFLFWCLQIIRTLRWCFHFCILHSLMFSSPLVIMSTYRMSTWYLVTTPSCPMSAYIIYDNMT